MSNPTQTELAQQEKHSADPLDLGWHRWLLVGAIVVYVVSLFLPFAGDTTGLQMLTFTEADGMSIAVTERLFTVLSFLCLVVFTLLTVILRRTSLALLAWMAGCVALVMALLGLWLRQTSSAAAAGVTSGAGIYVAILAVIVAIPVLSVAWMRRTPEQKRLEEQRREQTEFNPVADLQTDAATQAVRRTDGAGSIVDDRRQRAAQRHRQTGHAHD